MSEITERINLQTRMRNQLDHICDHFPSFADDHEFDLIDNPTIEIVDFNIAELRIPTKLPESAAKNFTDKFNELWPCPDARIMFTPQGYELNILDIHGQKLKSTPNV